MAWRPGENEHTFRHFGRERTTDRLEQRGVRGAISGGCGLGLGDAARDEMSIDRIIAASNAFSPSEQLERTRRRVCSSRTSWRMWFSRQIKRSAKSDERHELPPPRDEATFGKTDSNVSKMRLAWLKQLSRADMQRATRNSNFALPASPGPLGWRLRGYDEYMPKSKARSTPVASMCSRRAATISASGTHLRGFAT